MKRITIFVLSTFLFALSAVAEERKLDSDDSKTLYALGHSMARGLAGFDLTEEEIGIIEAGLRDGVLKRPSEVPMETYTPKIQAFARKRVEAIAVKEKEAAKGFLEKQENEKGAEKTTSGMIYRELKAGKGKAPEATSQVKVHYHGTLRDGTVFDSSVERKQPATFALNQVIPCWTEGVQKMKVGGKSRLVCPADLAYKDRGAPPHIRPGAPLVFEVELLEIVEKKAAAPKAEPKGESKAK